MEKGLDNQVRKGDLTCGQIQQTGHKGQVTRNSVTKHSAASELSAGEKLISPIARAIDFYLINV